MKKIRLFSLLVLIVASTIVAGAQTAEDIISKHIAATGGADNWKKLTSFRKTCSRLSRGVEIPIIITVLQGKGYKSETTTGGMTSYYIITEKAAWNYNPRNQQKAQAVPAETVKQIQDLLDIQGPLIDYQAKGNKVILYGTDDVEGTECYKLKVIMASGKEQTYFIDAASYYLVRISEKIKANGKESVLNTTYGDYQKLPEGIIYPMSYDNGFSTVNIKKIEFNIPVDEKIFIPSNL